MCLCSSFFHLRLCFTFYSFCIVYHLLIVVRPIFLIFLSVLHSSFFYHLTSILHLFTIFPTHFLSLSVTLFVPFPLPFQKNLFLASFLMFSISSLTYHLAAEIFVRNPQRHMKLTMYHILLLVHLYLLRLMPTASGCLLSSVTYPIYAKWVLNLARTKANGGPVNRSSVPGIISVSHADIVEFALTLPVQARTTDHKAFRMVNNKLSVCCTCQDGFRFVVRVISNRILPTTTWHSHC